jgi:mRNA-degrading endonuclease toxin of MazEF toxin-antitoxin module
MALVLRCGQIVWTEIADANGVRKIRPVVIITPDPAIGSAGTLDVVAVTSRLPDPLPDDHVLLPWHAQRHPRTGLNRKSAAVCSWMGQISRDDIQSVVGIISGPILAKIAAKLPPATP